MTPDGLRPIAAAAAIEADLREVLEATLLVGEMVRVSADGSVEWYAVAARSALADEIERMIG